MEILFSFKRITSRFILKRFIFSCWTADFHIFWHDGHNVELKVLTFQFEGAWLIGRHFCIIYSRVYKTQELVLHKINNKKKLGWISKNNVYLSFSAGDFIKTISSNFKKGHVNKKFYEALVFYGTGLVFLGLF